MAASLDRFSVKGPYEYNEVRIYEEPENEELLVCCGCGIDIDETESFIAVENPIAGKDYIHELDECLEVYYKKEKDLLGESKSSLKDNIA